MKTPTINVNETKVIMNKVHQYLRPDGLNSGMLVPVTRKATVAQYFSPTSPLMNLTKPKDCAQVIDFRFG